LSDKIDYLNSIGVYRDIIFREDGVKNSIFNNFFFLELEKYIEITCSDFDFSKKDIQSLFPAIYLSCKLQEVSKYSLRYVFNYIYYKNLFLIYYFDFLVVRRYLIKLEVLKKF